MMKNASIPLAVALFAGAVAHGAPPNPAGKPAGTDKVDPCETVARRKYDLCMHTPSADREQCLRDYDETYLRCKDPSAGTEPKTPAPSELSQGTYRVPFADGTKVHINRDFYDHNPNGKIDMAGRGGGTHRVVAAASGHIRYIQDTRYKQQHPERWLRNTDECFNNFVWIEHANGEWSKYSHMQQHSTTKKAGRKVGDFVAEGAYLGDEGHVGCAWPAHLHFEIVKPSSSSPRLGDPASGELEGYWRGQARNPVIRGLPGKTFKDGETYVINQEPTCKDDGDCPSGHYCNEGIDLTRNTCEPLKNDNDTCALVGGGHQCKSGKCRFSRCYTPGSVEMRGTCYSDDACKVGHCSDIDGVKGICVCSRDQDCGSGNWCDEGIDFKINECRAKLNKGASCGKAGSFGNDHKCKSGKCSGFPKYECK